MAAPLLDSYGEDGLPVGDDQQRDKAAARATRMVVLIPLISRAIGF
eukprot:CAMPEP_0185905780 /NCGR_PEP_ID=MMETSP0196C-20130402/4946_1 /TAXON_ID=2932 /ORGANISM="Alexandrium fundyense, Strain CCMP1719" /LENGTH=45 /DNA_ID= /DNA_START= /DNA_END= /DNA_ORIENTATION=